MTEKSSLFEVLPVELVEKILLYLTIAELHTFFQAFNRKYNLLSDHFWRKICQDEDFLQVNDNLDWSERFERGVNKRLGKFTHCYDTPPGKPVHAYSTSLVVSDSLNEYNVYSLNCKNKFELVQSITAKLVFFKDEFILSQNDNQINIYKHNSESNLFEDYKMLTENVDNEVFGISSKYCTVFHPKNKLFKIFALCDESAEHSTLPLPEDVKFVIEKILHNDNIVISTVTFNTGYRIKMFDITKYVWTLDIQCFSSTGITNDPNIWVGTNFIACCDVSYRLRGIYFGPFKVWNKQGGKMFEVEVEPSNHHYLRCFFKNHTLLLTTSDNCIKTFNSTGSLVSHIQTRSTFEDIKMSTGYTLFVLMKELPSVDVFNWKNSCHLFTIPLTFQCNSSLSSEFLYCPFKDNKYAIYHEYEVFKF